MSLPEAIEVRPYDPAWPQAAAAAQTELLGRLPGLFTAIEHIGSTAVPGLAAKPIIDLMAAAADLDRIVAHDVALAELGYDRHDTGMPDRLFYRRDHRGLRYHLHVVPADSWATRNERLLRDYLRGHPGDVRRYAELKRQLAARHTDGDDYTRGKTELIQELTDRARADRGLPSVPVWEELAGHRAARTVALALHGAALRAHQVGPAHRFAALVRLDVLAQHLGQDRGLADLDVAGRGEQGHGPGGRQRAQPAKFLALRSAGQLVQVAAAELVELGRVVPVPFAELGGRRGVLGPLVQVGRILAQAPRPDPVDEHPGAVGRRGRVINAPDPDLGRHWRPPFRTGGLPAQLYPHGLTGMTERLDPPAAGQRVHRAQPVPRRGGQPRPGRQANAASWPSPPTTGSVLVTTVRLHRVRHDVNSSAHLPRNRRAMHARIAWIAGTPAPALLPAFRAARILYA